MKQDYYPLDLGSTMIRRKQGSVMSTASTLHIDLNEQALMLYGIQLRLTAECDQLYQQEYILHRQMGTSEGQ